MRLIGFLILCFWQLSCSSGIQEKLNGVSFVASREDAAQEHAEVLVNLNANHAAVMPFGFIREMNTPEISFNTDRQWFGETKKGAKQYIELLNSNNIQVMLKPQLWIWRGEFTGNLKMNTEAEWETLETSYEAFIMTYVELAEEMKVPLFCIGTELEQFVQHRPDYWKKLIGKIKTVYSGKLTYAANWDEYPKTPFWKELDYIGIDAYFPLSKEKTPTVEQLRSGWQKHKEKMAAFSLQEERPILFTEYGYKSANFTGLRPWEEDRNDTIVNMEGQTNATRAILEEFWKEDWFAGGFVWKWFIHHKDSGGPTDNRFTPQNKPAEKVLRTYYQHY